MGLSAAEKQRRYRARRDANPEARRQYLLKEKEKYQKDKRESKKKCVKDMTSREHRATKRKWLRNQHASRAKKNILEQQLSPPSTPEAIPPVTQRRSDCKRKRSRKIRELKKTISGLKSQLNIEKKKGWKFKKRLQRLDNPNADTPNSKTKAFLKTSASGSKSKKNCRRVIVFHNSLLNQIKENYKSGKKSLNDLLSGAILRKYRVRTQAYHAFGIAQHKNNRKRRGSISNRVRKSVIAFFERDDVSRVLSGKRSTITKYKIKKQRRLLQDTLSHLHKKYLTDILDYVSFTTFWRLKPFWVTYPKASDRETCLCKTCENTKFLSEKLYSLNVLETAQLDILVKQVVCDPEEKGCMYGECKTCKDRVLPVKVVDPACPSSWPQWKTVKEKRTFKNGEEKEVVLTVKQEEHGTVGDLVDKLNDQLSSNYKRHLYNICHQYKHYRNLRSNLKPTECFIHVDFAENYVCKMHREIQSVHFGASQIQLTLHTGFYQVGVNSAVMFSGVSDSLSHTPAAVWAFLKPVLKDIKDKHPEVDTIHFFSDGPTTQYRQKINFYLLSTEIIEKGFSTVTWNFHEAGHGKGIPDGLGGTLKRTADRKVLEGSDIVNTKTFVEVLQQAGTSIKLYIISDTDIKQVEEKLKNKTLKTVPGTLRIHQVISLSPEHIMYRDVSCTCIEAACPGHSLRNICLISDEDNTHRKQNSLGTTKDSKKSVPSKNAMAFEDQTTNIEHTCREEEFGNHLKAMNRCKTFTELQEMCKGLQLNEISGTPRCLSQERLSVDHQSQAIYPSDVPCAPDWTPVKVRADGDCLPACGSVFAFGHDGRPNEIRVRIINELALHPHFYLTEDNLKKGQGSAQTNGHTKKAFAMYSDEFLPGVPLNDRIVQTIFEQEVLKITKPKTYMGVWQIFALASVLQMPVFSVYPTLGNPNVRTDLHRYLFPRAATRKPASTSDSAEIPALVMWTTTRQDMVQRHWVPNHFVPVVPHSLRAGNTEQPSQTHDVPSPEECLGKYVVVQYDKRPYPGFVEDIELDELHVDCMQSVGRSLNNCFFWSRRFRDKCWYHHEDILAVIPSPCKKTGSGNHYQIDGAAWEAVVRKLQADPIK